MKRIEDINTHCLEQFRNHWKCLDNSNHQLWQCRPFEWKLNKCVYDNLVRDERSHPILYADACVMLTHYTQKLVKQIPDQPPNVTPVEQRPQQILADRKFRSFEGKPFVPPQSSSEAKQ
jgi:NADH dehydrogenase (ubiquinone) 1 alpha subcomplex subunit 8